MSFKKSLVLASLAAGLFAFSAKPASANTIYYALTIDHCTGGCGGNGGVFGAIKLEDIAGGVNLTVLLSDGFTLVETGFPGGPNTPVDAAIAFNLDPDLAISVQQPSTQFALLSGNAGALKFNGFGAFEYALNCLLCTNGGSGGGLLTPLSVTLLGNGLDVGSFAEKSVGGSDLAYFAVDIMNGDTKTTGLVGASSVAVDNDPRSVPVPDGGSTMALLGSAFLGLDMLRRRFGKG